MSCRKDFYIEAKIIPRVPNLGKCIRRVDRLLRWRGSSSTTDRTPNIVASEIYTFGPEVLINFF